MQSGKCCGGCFLNIDDTVLSSVVCGFLELPSAGRCTAYKNMMGAVHLPWDKLTVDTACTNAVSQDHVLTLSFNRWPRVLMDATHLTDTTFPECTKI